MCQASGTIFFTNCNLHCQFCQNHDISQESYGNTVSPEELADMMLKLQRAGAHNINLVTPSHVTPQVLEALCLAISKGLRLPLVYNSINFSPKPVSTSWASTTRPTGPGNIHS